MNVIRNTSRVEIVLPNEYIVNELKNVMCYDIFSIVILLYAWYSCHENLNLARHLPTMRNISRENVPCSCFNKVKV